MSQPFNFNTPITENTTLVARYRCGSAPYAGNWFRWTLSDGTQYIPLNLGEAKKIFTGVNGYTTCQAINTATGEVSPLPSSSTLSLIEFGGGWDGFNPGTGTSNQLYIMANAKTVTITGYAEGLINPNISITPVSGGKVIFDRFKIDASQFSSLFNYNISPLFMRTVATSYGDISNGKYGTVELLDPPTGVTDSYELFSSAGDYAHLSDSYIKGYGFVGPYAQQCVEVFPPLAGSGGYYRKTYVA